MSDWLDENPSRWPSDPFELLGVERGADEKTIRRAFFRLAKKFKPDQAPVEFQLIHDAYESAKQYAAFHTHDTETDPDDDVFDSVPNDSDSEAIESIAPERAQSAFGGNLPHSISEQHSSQKQTANLFWDYVAKGKFEEAIRVIPQIESRQDRESAEFYRYYFERLKFNAQDRTQSVNRLKILLNFLTHSSHGGQAYRLLSNELESNPSLADNSLFTDFMRETKYAGKAVDVAALRWKALGSRHPSMVLDDVELLARFSIDLGNRWSYMIADAMEYTVWHDSNECREFNQKCWDDLSEARTGFEDQIELLIFASEQCRTPTHVLGFGRANQLIRESRTGFDRWMDKSWFDLA